VTDAPGICHHNPLPKKNLEHVGGRKAAGETASASPQRRLKSSQGCHAWLIA
jgi:hypothetical protein